MKTEFTLNYI